MVDFDRVNWYQHRSKWGEIFYHDPVDFYLSGRKGWSIGEDQLSIELLETLRSRGAKYFAAFRPAAPRFFKKNSSLKEMLDLHCKPMEVTKNWVIYRLP